MTDETSPDAVRFRAVLKPSRSLSPTGFLVLMAAVTLVNVATGVAFLLLGAWPVLAFCGLDVLVIYLAFRASYRDGRMSETIELDYGRLSLMRQFPSGKLEQFEMNPYWARVQIAETPGRPCTVSLASHGRELAFANFLGDDERREIANVLREQLEVLRTSAPIP